MSQSWMIKVQYREYKTPRWVLQFDHAYCIQRSRKTATRFQDLEKAQAIVRYLKSSCRQVEIVNDY
jgi:hypothetical protein